MNLTGEKAAVRGEKVSIPDIKYTIIGTVGYGKVEMSIGDDQDEDNAVSRKSHSSQHHDGKHKS